MPKPQAEIAASCALIWRNVDYLKDRDGLTDRELAEAIGKSVQAVSNKRTHPKLTTVEDVINLGTLFGVEPASLLLPMKPLLPERITKDYGGII